MRLVLLLLLCTSLVEALIIMPEKAMQTEFNSATISKKSMILTKKEHLAVQKEAKTAMKSKLFRVYFAKDKGIGILLTQRVRSKSCAVLYMMDTNGVVQNIEIIAFNEPKEYMPSGQWLDELKTNPNINSITGATLSASALMRASKLASAIWKVKLRK